MLKSRGDKMILVLFDLIALYCLIVTVAAIPYWTYRAIISLPFVGKLIRSAGRTAIEGGRSRAR